MLAPVGVHEVDLVAAEERDRPPVGRPGRSAPVARQPPLPASVGVHDIDAAQGVGPPSKAIFRPSGDQAGAAGTLASRVSLRCPLPSALMT